MDWRHPNVGCLFSIETLKPKQEIRSTRYARSVKNPPFYGLCTRDYERDHRPTQWPTGTEYQYAYCSNYRSLLPPPCEAEVPEELLEEVKNTCFSEVGMQTSSLCDTPGSQPFYKLYNVTPLPIIDKHYRGARYKADDPIGVRVPEELNKRRETPFGPVSLSCQDDLGNIYMPNYRYKEWISRPMVEIHKELDSNLFFAQQPETPTKYWDFYNVVRMRRPAKSSKSDQVYQPTTIVPIPMNKDIPEIPHASQNPHLGKLTNYHISEAPFQDGHFRSRVEVLCAK